jgi:hypothetical protein
MLVTPTGMKIPVKPATTNVSFPIVVTGIPLIVLGIVTFPPGPVYPVIVIVRSELTL